MVYLSIIIINIINIFTSLIKIYKSNVAFSTYERNIDYIVDNNNLQGYYI